MAPDEKRSAGRNSRESRESSHCTVCTLADLQSMPTRLSMEAARDTASEFQNYKIGQRIGKGRFGRVYSAEELKTGREVAVKLTNFLVTDEVATGPFFEHGSRNTGFPGDTLDMESACGYFLHEVSVMRHLEGAGMSGGAYVAHGFCQTRYGEEGFIVMGMVKGGPLLHQLPKRPPVQKLLGWATDLAAELQTLHDMRVLHRDIKLTNVCITSEGRATFVDYGLSVHLPEGTSSVQCEDRVGVLGYLAPEVYKLQPYGFPADIFEFGALLQKMFSHAHQLSFSNRMFQEANSMLFHAWGGEESYARFTQPRTHSSWPAPVPELVRACGARNPEERPSADYVLRRMTSGSFDTNQI